MTPLKKIAIALVSFVAWIALFLAVLATSLNFAVGALSQSGDTAAAVLAKVSTNQEAITSIYEEIKKNANPKLAAEIEKNKTAITEMITTLSASPDFQAAMAKALNGVAKGVLSGAKSVDIDFSEVAAIAAVQINKAAGAKVITKKDLANLKPKTVDISDKSTVVVNIKNKIHLALLFWVIWIALLVALFFLRRETVIKKAGRQLLSIGIPIIVLKFISPLIVNKIQAPGYFKDLVPTIANAFTGPVFNFGIMVFLIGAAILIVEKLISRRSKLSRDGGISSSHN